MSWHCPAMRVKLPAVIAALQLLPIEPSARERHTAMGTGIVHHKSSALSVAAEDKRHFQQRGLMQPTSGDLLAGQGSIPETK